MVELSVEHANDLAGLVADNGLLLGIVESRNSESALVVLVHVKVDIAQVGEALVDGVGLNVLAGLVVFGSGKPPSLLEHFPVDCGVWDDVFEALELADNQCSVCFDVVSKVSHGSADNRQPYPKDMHMTRKGGSGPSLPGTEHSAHLK